MPYYRCPDCDSIFLEQEEGPARYVWCDGGGLPLDVQLQVPGMEAPELPNLTSAGGEEQPKLAAEREPKDADGAAGEELPPAEELAPADPAGGRFERS